jgi:hypothetical protein
VLAGVVVYVPRPVPGAEVWLAGMPSDEVALAGSVWPRCMLFRADPGARPAEAAGLTSALLSEQEPPLQALQSWHPDIEAPAKKKPAHASS